MTSVRESVVVVTDEQIWMSHGDDLIRYANVLVGRDDAYDVVVAAFLRASRKGWRDVVDVRPYLYRAVTNEARNSRRNEARRRVRDRHALLPTQSVQSESQPEVRAAVADLSIKQRAVVYLSYWRDLSDAEIAELLQISRSSVRRHLDRAHEHLRKALQ